MSLSFYDKGQQVSIPVGYSDRIEYNPNAHRDGVDQHQHPHVSSFHKYQFYADRSKRWPFFTGNAGAELLVDMFRECDKALAVCNRRIAATADPEETEREGEMLYSRKPNIAGEGVTWSQEEYRHPGLQKRYLQLKSIQRYTESFAMIQRLYNQGFFEPYIRADLAYQVACAMRDQDTSSLTEGSQAVDIQFPTSPKQSSRAEAANANDSEDIPISSTSSTVPSSSASLPSIPSTVHIPRPHPFIAVSLGGGPGFELLALQSLLRILCPNTEVISVSADVEEDWREYAEAVGIKFVLVDLNAPDLRGNVQKALVEAGITSSSTDTPVSVHVDLYILSYVYHMYMSSTTPRSELLRLLSPICSCDVDGEIYHETFLSQPSKSGKGRWENDEDDDNSVPLRSSRYSHILAPPEDSSNTKGCIVLPTHVEDIKCNHETGSDSDRGSMEAHETNTTNSSNTDSTPSLAHAPHTPLGAAGICIAERGLNVPSLDHIAQDGRYKVCRLVRGKGRDDRQTLIARKGLEGRVLACGKWRVGNRKWERVEDDGISGTVPGGGGVSSISLLDMEGQHEPRLIRRAFLKVSLPAYTNDNASNADNSSSSPSTSLPPFVTLSPDGSTVLSLALQLECFPMFVLYPNVPYEEFKGKLQRKYLANTRQRGNVPASAAASAAAYGYAAGGVGTGYDRDRDYGRDRSDRGDRHARGDTRDSRGYERADRRDSHRHSRRSPSPASRRSLRSPSPRRRAHSPLSRRSRSRSRSPLPYGRRGNSRDRENSRYHRSPSPGYGREGRKRDRDRSPGYARGDRDRERDYRRRDDPRDAGRSRDSGSARSERDSGASRSDRDRDGGRSGRNRDGDRMERERRSPSRERGRDGGEEELERRGRGWGRPAEREREIEEGSGQGRSWAAIVGPGSVKKSVSVEEREERDHANVTTRTNSGGGVDVGAGDSHSNTLNTSTDMGSRGKRRREHDEDEANTLNKRREGAWNRDHDRKRGEKASTKVNEEPVLDFSNVLTRTNDDFGSIPDE